MKKTFLRIVCALLCAFTLTSLFACGEEGNGGKDDKFALTAENISEYKIVIPDDKASEFSDVAATLNDNIKSLTGKELEIKTDLINEAFGMVETEYEIILGKSDRSVISDYYRDVRSKDYGYALVGKKLIIIGESKDLSNLSVKLFKNYVLDKAAETDALLRDGESKINAGDYKYSEVKVNGVSISEYTIVYPLSTSTVIEEKRVAEELAKWLLLNTGYSVPCVKDSAEKTANEIQIGITNRVTDEMKADMESKISDDKYYASKNGQMLWAYGNNVSTISRAVNEIITSIGSDGEIKIDAPVCKEMQNIEVSVMSYNVRGMMDVDGRDSEGVITTIKAQNPDVFVAQEATSSNDAQSAKWMSRFDTALVKNGEYEAVKGVSVGKYLSYNPIYYKRDKFELISKGAKYLSEMPDKKNSIVDGSEYVRIATFAVLRDKTTGIEFLVTCTHLDTSTYQVRLKQATILAELMKDYPLLPVVVGGDFNTKYDASNISTTITTFEKNANLAYGAEIADEKPTLNVSTLAGEGNYAELGGAVIDYIFVSKSKITVQKYEHLDNKIGGRYPSDHLPVLANITIYG